MRKLLLMAAGLALLSTASLFATKEASQARGGDHLGVIWSYNEGQNVWRMPQQLNKMGNNFQVTRTATGVGNAEGGFFLNKKDMASTFGYALPINFGLYFNNSNSDFDRVSDNNSLVLPNDQAGSTVTQGSRLDIFLGGFGDSANLALRFGYNHVQRNVQNLTDTAYKDVSVIDFALGGTYQGWDFWGKAAMEPSSDNNSYKNNSLSTAYQFGVRKELAGFRLYAEYNEGAEEALFGRVASRRVHYRKDNTSTSFELGAARVHKVKDSGEFFWDARLAWVDIAKTVAALDGGDINQSPVKGYAFHMTAGISHKLFSWLHVVGSLEADLLQDLDKMHDGNKDESKGNLGFSVQSGGFQLDLTASTGFDTDDQNIGLLGLLNSTSGTISYNF